MRTSCTNSSLKWKSSVLILCQIQNVKLSHWVLVPCNFYNSQYETLKYQREKVFHFLITFIDTSYVFRNWQIRFFQQYNTLSLD